MPFINDKMVELAEISIGSCEQMLPITWYSRVIEKYDNNPHNNTRLNVELKIANNVKNIHKNDNGKRIGEEWVTTISTKVHSNTPKIKDIKATLWFLSCILKNVIPIGRNDATKNIFIKNIIISNPCVVIIIHKFCIWIIITQQEFKDYFLPQNKNSMNSSSAVNMMATSLYLIIIR